MSEKILAWHGDPDLKAMVVAKMKQHRAQDEFIQGNYQYAYTVRGQTKWKGCAIGCTLPYLSIAEMQEIAGGNAMDFSWHQEVQKQYGIERDVAKMIDSTFELCDGFEAAGDFAVAVIEAIPVGADLSRISYADPEESWGPQELIEALATAPVPE